MTGKIPIGMTEPLPDDLTDRIVADGACIGCGLCAGVSDGAIRMAFTPQLRERPVIEGTMTGAAAMDALAATAACCPGLVAEGLTAEEAGTDEPADPMWGYWHQGYLAWAGDAEIRHRGSSGGVLSALAAHLLESDQADFILHLAPDPDHPARSRFRISRTPAEAADTGGSRYGPGAPLAGLAEARKLVESGLGRFAFIGKPCDVSAIRLLAKREAWLRESLVCRLTIMCGGASQFTKTAALLADWGIAESDLTELRYRGYGNPGPTVARTKDGKHFETSYQALWEDESQWVLQHRCKICPDAIGMAADLVSFDCWPGGGPDGEDEGFNAVITRTPQGNAILEGAVKAGAVVKGRAIDADDLKNFQPHQARKRLAVWSRLTGQRAAGKCAPQPRNLFTRTLAKTNGWKANLAQARGTRKRLREGRATEPKPVAADNLE